MNAIESHRLGMSPERLRSTTPSPPLTTGSNTPSHGHSPSQTTIEAQQKRKQRHSKKLSINFPILVPARGNDTPNLMYTASPTALSAQPTMHGAFFSPLTSHAAMPSMSMPLTPPCEEDYVVNAGVKGRGHGRHGSTSTEFLTMLASQERRVLELKEELSRAENELTALKKQWAIYEAGKKKNEIKGAPTRSGSVKAPHTHNRATSVVDVGTGLGLSGVDDNASEDKVEAEREKMRELLRERMLGRLPNTENTQSGHANSKKNQRVFSSSRHTRTLSLLTTNTTKNEQNGSLDNVTHGKTSLDSAREPSPNTPASSTNRNSIPPLTRSNSTLEALSLGKTYKDLATAATRKNLPQGLSPEQFVKQGKQMVDGVRDGLWNFFEDIRQATVGEEAISGIRRQTSTKHHHNYNTSVGNAKLKRTMTDAGGKENVSETSFWREFGVDTPKSEKVKRENTAQTSEKGESKQPKKEPSRPSLPGRWPSTKAGEDLPTAANPCPKHEHGKAHGRKKQAKDSDVTQGSKSSKSKKDRAEQHVSNPSTDSRNPPSLVSDTVDDEDECQEEEEDENWEHWESNSLLEPGSPAEKRASLKGRERDGKMRVVSGASESELVKDVQWHGLVH